MLKLMALDGDDLPVISAHMQDAVFKAGDIRYVPKTATLSLAVNRFVWEQADGDGKAFERRRAVLVFKQVKAVRSIGVNRKAADQVLDLLAIVWHQTGDGPEGTIELVLAGNASIRLDVDCIEVQLADTGGAWETTSMPRHPTGA